MNGYLSDRVQVTLIYLPFQSPANRSLNRNGNGTETGTQLVLKTVIENPGG